MDFNSALIVTIVSMVFSAFFSGMEIAFITSNRVRVGLDVQKKGLTSSLINIFYSHQDMFISTMLVGNNIALVIFGICVASLTRPWLADLWDQPLFIIIGQALVATIAILLTSEFFSNTLFRINPDFWLRLLAIPTYLFYLILYPVTRFSTVISDSILRLSGIKVEKDTPENAVSIDELDEFLQQSLDEAHNDPSVDTEVKILQNALEFSSRNTRECMIPRPEIIAVNIDETTEESLIKRFTDSGFSKIPVYKDNIDHIIGYIHSSDLFKRSSDWKTLIRPILQVAETMPAQKLMKQLMQQKKSIAVVVDEYGSTSGIITLEDLVEEIFGDIEDEHDKPAKDTITDLGNNVFEMSAILIFVASRFAPAPIDDTTGMPLSRQYLIKASFGAMVSMASTTTSTFSPSNISPTPSASRYWPQTLRPISGFISLSLSARTSHFGLPMVESSASSCLFLFVTDTVSLSMMIILPTPARAIISAAKPPTPPAPITATVARASLATPSCPMRSEVRSFQSEAPAPAGMLQFSSIRVPLPWPRPRWRPSPPGSCLSDSCPA